jgi:hypothetical protein
MSHSLIAALKTLRPRSIAEARSAAAHARTTAEATRTDVAELRRTVKTSQAAETAARAEQTRALQGLVARLESLESSQGERLEAIARELSLLRRDVVSARLRADQVRAVMVQERQLEKRLPDLERVIANASTGDHIREAIAKTTLHLEPFPYMIVDDLLPTPLFSALVRGLPPTELFADRPKNKQQLTVPFDFGSRYSLRIWHHMARTIAPEFIMPAIAERFRAPMREWLAETMPTVSAEQLEALPLTCSDGRILLRGPGYRIPPHRDPKWGFVTALVYLPREGDDDRWGTHLFSVSEDPEAVGAKPHWIDERLCTLVKTVEFRQNRTLFFLNSRGAHGADIPADAEPATLERYAYQFRIGPSAEGIQSLLDAMPEDRAHYWQGKNVSY